MSGIFYHDPNIHISSDLQEGHKPMKSVMDKSFSVYLCPECDRVFDAHERKSVHTYYIKNFPRYGIKKQLCRECKIMYKLLKEIFNIILDLRKLGKDISLELHEQLIITERDGDEISNMYISSLNKRTVIKELEKLKTKLEEMKK